MILKLFVIFYSFNFCAISASMEANSKSVIPVPTADWNDIKGHSYLRLATPSGNIYHFTDDQGLVRELGNATEISSLPFLTVVQNRTEHYIYLLNNETGYQVLTRVNTKIGNLSHHLELYEFTGVDGKQYNANLYRSSPSVDKVWFKNDTADYLEIKMYYDKWEVLTFTFTEDGSDLIDIVNCSNVQLVTRSKANAYSSLLPYITFLHRDGQWLDVFFIGNGSLPYLMKNRSMPSYKCGDGIRLRKFKGPDNIHYELENNWTIYGEGRYYFKVSYGSFDGDVEFDHLGFYKIYRFSDDDELELIGEFRYPDTQPRAGIDFKCLKYCID